MVGYLLLIAIPLTLFAYFPTFSHVFRSDHWILINWFNALDFNIKNIISAGFFDSFKHGRCQPLAYVILFLQYKLFGTNIFLYHLIQYTLHIINGILLFTLIKKLGVEKIYAILCSILFLTFYSHFDIIGWTFHLYIILQTTFFLVSFIFILKYFENNKKIYIFLSSLSSFILLLIYEPAIFVPIFSIIFFILLCQRENKMKYKTNLKIIGAKAPTPGIDPLGSSQTLLKFLDFKILSFCNILSYIFFASIFIYIKTSKSNLLLTDFSFFEWLIRTFVSAALCIFGTLFYHNLGLPSQTITTDIVYLGKLPITTPFFLLITFFVLLLILCFYHKDKQTRHLILMFTVILLSYIFIISAGRTFTNFFTYTYRQPRYSYFPNLIFSIIVALLFSKWKTLNKFKKIPITSMRFSVVRKVFYTFLYHKKVTTIALFSALFILNINKIHNYNKIISEQLSPIKQYIEEIENFISKQDKKDFKIFINFSTGTKEFFWGSDITLDVYFYLHSRQNILTKKIYEANYIYDKDKGIYPNQEVDMKKKNKQDFTFEFKTIGILYLKEEGNLFGEKNGDWYISITEDKKIRFAKKTPEGYKIFETKDSFFLNYQDAHLIIEREKNTITVAEYNNTSLLKINKIIVADDFTFEFPTQFNKYLGEHYSGKDCFGFLKDLFIIIGKTKYGFDL